MQAGAAGHTHRGSAGRLLRPMPTPDPPSTLRPWTAVNSLIPGNKANRIGVRVLQKLRSCGPQALTGDRGRSPGGSARAALRPRGPAPCPLPPRRGSCSSDVTPCLWGLQSVQQATALLSTWARALSPGRGSWPDPSLLVSHISARAERGTTASPPPSGVACWHSPVSALPGSRPDIHTVVGLFFFFNCF